MARMKILVDAENLRQLLEAALASDPTELNAIWRYRNDPGNPAVQLFHEYNEYQSLVHADFAGRVQ